MQQMLSTHKEESAGFTSEKSSEGSSRPQMHKVLPRLTPCSRVSDNQLEKGKPARENCN